MLVLAVDWDTAVNGVSSGRKVRDLVMEKGSERRSGRSEMKLKLKIELVIAKQRANNGTPTRLDSKKLQIRK